MSQLTRRSVLALGAGTAGTAALVSAAVSAPADAAGTPAGAKPAVKVAPKVAATAPLVRSHFRPGLHSVFTATLGTRAYQLTLTEILDLTHAPAKHAEDCFLLLFTARGKDAPAEGIYTLKAKGVTESTLFLSGTAAGTGGQRQLQAVVNRAR
jgi:hypothetical protein